MKRANLLLLFVISGVFYHGTPTFASNECEIRNAHNDCILYSQHNWDFPEVDELQIEEIRERIEEEQLQRVMWLKTSKPYTELIYDFSENNSLNLSLYFCSDENTDCQTFKKNDRSFRIDESNEHLSANTSLRYIYSGPRYNEDYSYDRLMVDLKHSIKITPEDIFNPGHDSGNEMQTIEPNESISEYDEAIEMNTDEAINLFNRGNAYKKAGDFDTAINEYNSSIELNPNDADTYYNRGNTYRLKDDYDQAIRDFRKYLELNPDAEDRVEVLEMIEQLENEAGN